MTRTLRLTALDEMFITDDIDIGGGLVGFGRTLRTMLGGKKPPNCTLWWSRLGSNQRPSACEADALPLSHGTGAERRTTSNTSTTRAST